MSAAGLWGQDASGAFQVKVTSQPGVTGAVLRVDFAVAPQCVLYAQKLHFQTSDGKELRPLSIPEPVMEWDETQKEKKAVYEHSFAAMLNPVELAGQPLVIRFQGCTNGACFAPEKLTFAAQSDGRYALVPDADGAVVGSGGAAVAGLQSQLKEFKVLGRQTGYLKAAEFNGFLERALSGRGAEDDPLARFQNLGLAATLLLIVLGGFLLNFTPCVLPMIPINLAIIGAGSSAKSRVDGFRNGSVYGIGMALAYGTLGLAVVLTGAKFGALNSSAWFNVVIAVVFLVMALGMFDVINIDLSRFSAGIGPQRQSNAQSAWLRHLVVFTMGVLAALLAGACVAPVVVSVMLLAASLYTKGLVAGLLLPFLLGVGMALPWPFAGAGLAILPKPGKWMKRVKYGFGVVIVLFAVYYGHLGYHAYAMSRPVGATLTTAAGAAVETPGAADQANQDLLKALQQARAEHRPVLVDFHASWCKNCLAMDQTVFNQAEVQQRLKDFIVVRYAAEQPNQSPVKEVLDHFGVMGLPSYLVVKLAE